jgi:Carboxypeptidase regulatory-like domain
LSKLLDLKEQFEQLQNKYQEYLPKVDADVINDLLTRQRENPLVTPIYMLEVFTKEGIDSQKARDFIFNKMGMMPAIYDNGTHYVINQKLTLEMLKEISDSEDVLEVTGEYTGSIGGFGPSHEHLDHKHAHDYHLSKEQQQLEEQRRSVEEKKIYKGLNNHKLLIYTVVGVIGALALSGFIISGGLLPNVNKGAPPLAQTSSPSFPALSGAIHGYVGGPEGLPAIGAAVVAAEQQTGYTVNSIVSVDGHYSFSLPAGNYIVLVAYPDGTNKKVSNFVVEQGTDNSLDFKY